jgi:hypothetical protein
MAVHLGTTGLRTVSVEGPAARYAVDEVFGAAHETRVGPQVYLVRQSAGGTTRPHFHEVDQYQVFTRGNGSFGRQAIEPTAVHYADAHTSYGPIVAGGDGIDYFTARFRATCGTHFMPESRKRKRKSGRHYTVAVDEGDAEGSDDLAALIERQDDGLAAYRIRVAPGDSVTLPQLAGWGRLATIMRGSLIDPSGVEHGIWSWSYLDSPGEPHPCLAGPAGATVLCLDYPHERDHSLPC